MNTPTENTEHTPGPWIAVSRPDEERQGYTQWEIKTDESDPTWICQLFPYQPDGCSPEANAALIARAPALLAENARLREALQLIVEWCQPPALKAEGNTRQPKQSMIETARAALAVERSDKP